MTSSNQLLGRSAAPYTLEHDGRVYQFRALAQVEKSAFRAWLLGRTREVLAALYTGAELERELKTLTKDAIAGSYDFGSPVAKEVMGTPEGVIRLASILSGCEPDEILRLWGERPEEVKHLLELVVAESLRRHGLKESAVSSQASEGNGQSVKEEPAHSPFPEI